MATRMLIDARHSEETRVAVLKGNRIEEFDFESAEHKQIKGNIYLAKVTRVEPSLQAAFVDFGGNRHGFLAFNEIHPDYYQIPQSDREALLAEEAEAAEEEARLRAEEEEEGLTPGDEYDADDESAEALAEDLAEDGLEEIDTSDKDKVSTIEDGTSDDDGEDDDDDSDDDEESEENSDDGEDTKPRRGRRGRGRRRQGRGKKSGNGRSRAKEVDEVRAKRMALRRRYKIQDVIQRRQVLLVQVVKEERGNKGAALTTYLSLAGRYTVLMPNSSHGGGISRKINSSSDRKRLKEVVSSLSLPKSMGLIVRTAGLSRTKTEIKRDFDYLARLWDGIRQNTLSSTAPALIHSDSDLIKRAIRDIYNREIEEVIVEGAEGYKSAKAFMKMLMPSHARRVKAYSDPVPLFQRYGAEDQLRAMYDPMVQLKSGGYLIINPTEALVSIDINSGRSTKEHGIEQTALHTNLEAAREIARQLRLRDMAGLVVIDFIDMEYNSNVRKVEKAMKEALKNDRARIQVGRISGFGLMEMSRQRLRTGVLEATTRECPHCDGTGLVRTASSAGLSALRLIEDEAAKGKGTVIKLAASTEAAIYMLNEKRGELVEIEERYGVTIEVSPEGEDEGAKMSVSSMGPRPAEAPKFEPIVDDEEDDDIEAEEGFDDEDDQPRKKRRRRRGGRGRNKKRQDENSSEGDDDSEETDADENASDESASDKTGDGEDKPKRRRRRGGRGRRRKQDGDSEEKAIEEGAEALEEVAAKVEEDVAVVAAPDAEEDAVSEPEADAKPAKEEKPKRKRAPRKKKADIEAETPAEDAAEEKPARRKRATAKKADTKDAATQEAATDEAATEEAKEEKPKRKRAPRKKKVEAETEAPAAEPDAAPEAPAKAEAKEDAPAAVEEASSDGNSDDSGPKKRGWWQRTFGE
ncbi:Rne/Rng family ribonuclease [Qipengyuania sp. S6317L1]|uniref:Rne/Rng family ribonuclease n=1 Tax=Qipengyuania sp. S6317L1 TaxID=2926410 RepID=UPI001FF47EFC|nr:Rne/Rng family ribonuclease [Qipengyuania sp. S6317L1]MCK0099452.1 Rne/Rng family ribonuclease [Qipengyuania sp. S6317L1]